MYFHTLPCSLGIFRPVRPFVLLRLPEFSGSPDVKCTNRFLLVLLHFFPALPE